MKILLAGNSEKTLTLARIINQIEKVEKIYCLLDGELISSLQKVEKVDVQFNFDDALSWVALAKKLEVDLTVVDNGNPMGVELSDEFKKDDLELRICEGGDAVLRIGNFVKTKK